MTEDDLRSMGVEDPDHITTIIMHLKKQQQGIQQDGGKHKHIILGNHSLTEEMTFVRRNDFIVSSLESNSTEATSKTNRKYSRTSSLDPVKPTTNLFRRSIVPRLHRRDNYKDSTPCLHLPPHIQEDDHSLSRVQPERLAQRFCCC